VLSKGPWCLPQPECTLFLSRVTVAVFGLVLAGGGSWGSGSLAVEVQRYAAASESLPLYCHGRTMRQLQDFNRKIDYIQLMVQICGMARGTGISAAVN
jgi:hypothetical protein